MSQQDKRNNPDRPVERDATDVGDLNPRTEPDREELGTSPAGTAGIAGLSAPYGSTQAAEKDVIDTVTRGGSGGPGPGGAPVPGSVNDVPDPTTPSPGDESIPGLENVRQNKR
jgi:hypothetical protein